MLVYCVLCTGDTLLDNDVVHIFSTMEKAEAFAKDDQRNHVLYDYVVDHPERMEERSQ